MSMKKTDPSTHITQVNLKWPTRFIGLYRVLLRWLPVGVSRQCFASWEKKVVFTAERLTL